MMKRSSISRSRSVAIEASMKGWRQPPAYSLRYAIMMCASASSRAFRSVSAMIRSRVRGHSVIAWLRPAARRLSRNRFLPSRSRLRSEVVPVWFEQKDGSFWINGGKNRGWFKHLQRDPRITLLLIDPKEMFRWAQVEGRMVNWADDPGGDHI